MNPSAAAPWIAELGLDNSILMDDTNHRDDFMDSFDEEIVASMGQELHNCLSSQIVNNSISTSMEPEKQAQINPNSDFSSEFSKNRTASINKPDQASHSSSPIILNFANTDRAESSQLVNHRRLNPDEERVVSAIFNTTDATYHMSSGNGTVTVRAQPTKKRTRIRQPSQTYDHIIAERKRREQISQLFIALSAIVPGLKKTDKSSVLGDAIKYLKELQDRVEMLEARQSVESAVLVRKSRIIEEEEEEDGDEGSDEQLLPQIEARVCSNTFLIRVHCLKHKGVLVNLLCTVDNLNLSVVSSNITAFGNLSLDITIIAEMEKEFNLSVKEVVTALRSALSNKLHHQPLQLSP